MRVGSLFSGYGGLDMAVERYFGATTAWHVEFDKHPSTVLAQRWPGVPNYGDVTAVDWSAVEPVDILTGGFPCQDVSHAGLRRGIKPGTRSGLWEHFAYAIQTLRPRLVVIENVSGLLSADAHCDVEPCPWCLGDEPDGHMRALGAVLSDLAEIGFDAEWGVLPASAVGAPHRRDRVFVVAADAARERIDGAGGSRPRRWAEPTDSGDEPVTLLPTPSATDGSGAMKPEDRAQSGAGYRPALRDVPYLLPTPAVNDMGRGKTVEDWDAWTAAMQQRHGNGNGHGKSLEIEAQRLLPTPSAADGMGGHLNRSGDRKHEKLLPGIAKDMHADFGPYTAAIARWEAVLGRPAPSPTEPGKDGRPRLSPRFVEWMQGLPDGWVCDTGIPRNAQLKALGNGVVPQQAALALSMLLPRLYVCGAAKDAEEVA